MKWFAKYWVLFYEHKELQKKYDELLDLIDDDFWDWILDE